jgi:Chromosome segregation ATPases
MKYLVAILITLGIGGYFAYQKADEHYQTRVSGQVAFWSDGKAKFEPNSVTEGEHVAYLKSSTIKVGWNNAWDAWPALLTAVLAGIFVFGGLYIFTAENLADAELKSDIERLKKRLESETERAGSAQSDARKELEAERNEAKNLQRQADKITIEAEARIEKAKRFEEEAKSKINQAMQYAKQMEQERDQAKKDAGHAISGINRHKRKIEKLKNDGVAFWEFLEKHHSHLLGKNE